MKRIDDVEKLRNLICTDPELSNDKTNDLLEIIDSLTSDIKIESIPLLNKIKKYINDVVETLPPFYSYGDNEAACTITGKIKNIIDYIDSLAVEVPEAKPGAISELLSWIDNSADIRFEDDNEKHAAYQIVDNARAELAQLQAEREEANAIIRSWINGDVEEGKSLEQKAREYLRKVGL